jgi:hypothetical protein
MEKPTSPEPAGQIQSNLIQIIVDEGIQVCLSKGSGSLLREIIKKM